MTKKNEEVSSFVFYRSFYDVVTLIPDEAMRCRAYTAICEYAFHGVEPAEDEDVLVKMVFTQAKPQIDANNKRRENASAGGVAKKKKMEAKKSADVVPNMCQNTANGVPNVNANETVNEPVKVHAHENVTAIRFTPPALEDVQAYIAEQSLNIDAERFVDYYTANGWMVGKNKMRDWKAALRHWNRADERNMAKHRGYDSNPRMKGGDHNGTSAGKLRRSLDCACDTVTDDTGMDPLEHYFTYTSQVYNEQEGNLHEQDGYVCDKCKNKGYIAKAVWTEMGYWTRVDYECECKNVRDNIARLKKSGLQDGDHYRFATYQPTETWQDQVKQLAMDYVNAQVNGEGAGHWFFIGGVSGAGKSHICTAICRELIFKGKDVRYMLWRDESVKLKATVNDAAQYENHIQELKTVDVLYIDDFFKCGQNDGGVQRPTTGDINLAMEILNYRYNHTDKITIISSESTLDEIFSVDAAVGGRIGERAMGYAINLSGKEKNYRCKMMGVAV